MKKSLFATLLSILTVVLVTSCKPTAKQPLSERIAKVWTARTVQENSTTVFTRGGTSNAKPGYSNFRLDLGTSNTVTLREVDNNTFTGQWEVQGENKLILKNLTPQPTGTNGTIEFTIDSISDTELKLTRTTASQKTGGTMNVYTLSNP